jgi:heme exporter protein A
MRLRAWDLTLERGGRRLFEALSFTVEAGAALVVTGANGVGKSSLLRALLGFLPLQAGGFALDGGDAERTLGEQAHYLGHADALKSALTAGENLLFWAGALGGAASRETAISALERVGLAHVVDFAVCALSAGQKRRVAIARLLVAARPLWLLDEPTAALDAGAQRAFAAILETHLRGGGVIVAATHADLGLRDARALRLGARAELAA